MYNLLFLSLVILFFHSDARPSLARFLSKIGDAVGWKCEDCYDTDIFLLPNEQNGFNKSTNTLASVLDVNAQIDVNQSSHSSSEIDFMGRRSVILQQIDIQSKKFQDYKQIDRNLSCSSADAKKVCDEEEKEIDTKLSDADNNIKTKNSQSSVKLFDEKVRSELYSMSSVMYCMLLHILLFGYYIIHQHMQGSKSPSESKGLTIPQEIIKENDIQTERDRSTYFENLHSLTYELAQALSDYHRRVNELTDKNEQLNVSPRMEVEDNVKLLLIKAAEENKNAILKEVERFKKMCKESQDTISSLVSSNKTQSNALEFFQFELVAYAEQEKTSSILETAVSQQGEAFSSSQNHVATLQSFEIEDIQRYLDVQNVHTQTNESESIEMARLKAIIEKSEVQLSELKAAHQNDIQTERDRAIDFENKVHELNLSNTSMVQMNQRYELEIHSLKYDLDHFKQSLIDCQKNLNGLTLQNKKVEEALRIKNEVTYQLLRVKD